MKQQILKWQVVVVLIYGFTLIIMSARHIIDGI